MDKTDLYFKKNIEFWLDSVSLTFRVSQALFSSHQVDVGTQRLLKSIQDLPLSDHAKILDLGCGYGPIGLTLAKKHPDSHVHLVDRDALAVEYARQNAVLNTLDNCIVYGSLGFDEVTERNFDLIISNIPGKAGEDVIIALLEHTRHHLKPGGMVALVVVAPLEELVTSVLSNPDIEVRLHSHFKDYAVFHYCYETKLTTKPNVESLSLDMYSRASVELSVEDHIVEIETAFGLPEFDTLDYQTDLLIKVLVDRMPDAVNHLVVCNPGQGYIPVILWHLCKPERITLISRDLLSLRYATHNLQNNGCEPSRIIQRHQVGWVVEAANAERVEQHPVDCVVGVLRNDEGPEVNDEFVNQVAGRLSVGGSLFVAGGSTPITRLLKSLQADKRLVLKKRRKHQGRSVAVLLRQ